MGSYAFLTTKGFRIEEDGRNIREAYKKAKKKFEKIKSKDVGRLLRIYMKFDKNDIGGVWKKF